MERIKEERAMLADRAHVEYMADRYKLPPLYYAEQIRFLATLTQNELTLLKSYTFVGDTIMNSILRGDPRPDIAFQLKRLKRTYPQLMIQDDFPGFIPEYLHAFMNVFKKAPVLKAPLFVYRGLKATAVASHRANEFVSTSTSEIVAAEFSTKDGCCLLRLAVQPGVRTIWMPFMSESPSEMEVLVGGPADITHPSLDPTTETWRFRIYNAKIVPVRRGGRKSKRNKRKRT